MFKLILRGFSKEWINFIGTLLTSAAGALLGAVSANLFGAIIYESMNGSGTLDLTAGIAVFASLFGFIIGFTILSLSMSINYSIVRRTKYFMRLRVLGVTFKSLSWSVVIESLLIMIVALIVSLPIGVEVAKPIFNQFVDLGVVSSSISISFNPIIMSATAVIFLVLTFSVSWLSTRKLKKISIIDSKSQEKHEKLIWIIIKLIIGIGILIVPIVIATSVNLSGNKLSVFIAIWLFVPAIGLAICGKYIIKGITWSLYWITKPITPVSHFFAQVKASSTKLMSIVVAVALVLIYQGVFSANSYVSKTNGEYVARALNQDRDGYQTSSKNELDDLKVTSNITKIYKGSGEYIKDEEGDKKDFKRLSYEMVDGGLHLNVNDINGNTLSGIVIPKGHVILSYDMPDAYKTSKTVSLKINGTMDDFIVDGIARMPIDYVNNVKVYVGYDPSIKKGLNKFLVSVKKGTIFNETNFRTYDWQTSAKQVNVINEKSMQLTLWSVIIFSAVNVFNSLMLFIYDKRKQNGLKRKLGVTKTRVSFSMLLELLFVLFVGVMFSFITILTFTLPASSASPVVDIILSDSWLYFAIIGIIVTLMTGMSFLRKE